MDSIKLEAIIDYITEKVAERLQDAAARGIKIGKQGPLEPVVRDKNWSPTAEQRNNEILEMLDRKYGPIVKGIEECGYKLCYPGTPPEWHVKPEDMPK